MNYYLTDMIGKNESYFDKERETDKDNDKQQRDIVRETKTERKRQRDIDRETKTQRHRQRDVCRQRDICRLRDIDRDTVNKEERDR